MFAFISWGNEFKSQLYVMLVRPHMRYYVHWWLAIYRKDGIKLDRMPRRFTTMILGQLKDETG